MNYIQTRETPPMSGAEKLSITAIILTFDEEAHIARCVTRIAPLVQRIVVVDSFSTDRTVEIARGLGAEVVQRAFINQAEQFQWAQANCAISTDWVLRLDADEYLESGLIEAIRRQLGSLPEDVTGVNLRRKVIFRNRWIRHGGYYTTVLTRLWRIDAGYHEQRWMDERVVLTRGRSIRLTGGDLVDHNLKDIGWWTEKHNRYATRQMVDFINREYHLFPIDDSIEREGHAQGRWKRFLRNRLFAGAPLYLRSALYFFYRYFFRFGFLDGREGFVFHALHGFWYFLLIDAKIDEARNYIDEHGLETFRDHLRRHHRIAI
jgi:glycosyltransferase involved in cell wall biosynthesis